MRLLAVVKSIEIVGEAASKVSSEAQALFPQMPWRGMKTMRNRLVHGYDTINFDVVWQTVCEDLPRLAMQLESALGSGR